MIALYEGKEMMSLTYCERLLKEFNNEMSRANNMIMALKHPMTFMEQRSLKHDIETCEELIRKLSEEFSNVSDDEKIEFMIQQIVSKVEGSNSSTVVVSYQPVFENENTVRIKVYEKSIFMSEEDMIFSTELTLDDKVYVIRQVQNERYDGVFDLNEYETECTKTSLLQNVKKIIKKELVSRLPQVKIE